MKESVNVLYSSLLCSVLKATLKQTSACSIATGTEDSPQRPAALGLEAAQPLTVMGPQAHQGISPVCVLMDKMEVTVFILNGYCKN